MKKPKCALAWIGGETKTSEPYVWVNEKNQNWFLNVLVMDFVAIFVFWRQQLWPRQRRRKSYYYLIFLRDNFFFLVVCILLACSLRIRCTFQWIVMTCFFNGVFSIHPTHFLERVLGKLHSSNNENNSDIQSENLHPDCTCHESFYFPLERLSLTIKQMENASGQISSRIFL